MALRLVASTSTSRLQTVAQTFSCAPSRRIHVAKTVVDMRALRDGLGKKKVGFVPTMGCLHEGHLDLVRTAKRECDVVVSSIFVNPAQFAPHEDFDKYPRRFESDVAMLKSEGVEAVFAPTVPEMYTPGTSSNPFDNNGTFVEVKGISQVLEGKYRPQFFIGVATVVNKLLNVVQPTHMYLGQKDAQQCVVLQNMVRDLLLPTIVRVCPTRREKDGLAMSSRNVYLSEEHRRIAPVFSRGLFAAQEAYTVQKVKDRKTLIDIVEKSIRSNPEPQIQYISLAHPMTLKELDVVGPEGAILSGALFLGKTRLIDNVQL
eukprot:Opistho-2@80693